MASEPSSRFIYKRRLVSMLVASLFAPGWIAGLAAAQNGPAASERVQVEKAPGRLVVLRAADYNAYSRLPKRDRAPSPPGVNLAPATFDVTYVGFSPQAQAAFQAAVDVWASVLESSQTIRVLANWTPLNPGVLGSAGATSRYRNFLGAPLADFWFPSPLADDLANADHDPADYDIVANFASNLPNWYLGTDGNTPADKYDLLTVVMHELGHGLGFSGSMRVDDGMGQAECNGVAGVGCFGRGNPVGPDIYDLYAETGAGSPLTSLAQNSTTLGDELTGGNIFFDSPGATAANGGNRPELYAPNPAEPGSTYSHLDEIVFPAGDPDSLMTPQLALSESIMDPGDIALCMFEDMGWRTTASCSGGGLVGPEVLFNLTAGCFGQTVISQYFSDFDRSVEAADDFVVPPGGSWSIETVAVRGLYTVDGGPADSVNVTIFNDGASPGTVVCSRPAQIPSSGLTDGRFVIDLTSPCDLDPGTYWLSVQAVMDLNPGPDQQAWAWTPNGFSVNGDPFEWQDTTDLFALGCTTWTPHASCSGIGSPSDNDLCFGFLGSGGVAAEIFADGFESGNTSAWSSVAP